MRGSADNGRVIVRFGEAYLRSEHARYRSLDLRRRIKEYEPLAESCLNCGSIAQEADHLFAEHSTAWLS